MPLVFYPHVIEGSSLGTLDDRIELLADSAQRYKAVVLETATKNEGQSEKHLTAPKDMSISFNWDLISSVLREVRELPEGTRDNRKDKAERLAKLSEIYEVLRSAKMARLEAVRLALMSEANQLRGGSSGSPNSSTQVA